MKHWRIDTPSQTMIITQKGAWLPFVCYWNAALPENENLEQIALSNQSDISGGMLDELPIATLSPQRASSFQGQPGSIFKSKDGKNLLPTFDIINVEQTDHVINFICKDSKNGLTLRFEILAHISCDMFELKTSVESLEPILIDWLSTPVLPAPQHSIHTIEVAGRWCGEFQLHNNPWTPGARLREAQSGRTGHEDFPGLLIPETSTNNSSGGCFGFHYGWSGGHRMITEELSDGQRQVQFGHASDTDSEFVTVKETASLYATYSGHGINGIARNFQNFTREHILPKSDENAPRLVHYNCWEAVYFDHDLDELKDIATRAKTLGAERFVLDDGWFGKRNDDTTSLGDWDIDKSKFPDGLSPLISHIHNLGMEFGLWFEPEMINPDSELYRTHPDWALGAPDQVLGRNQMVLDLRREDVRDFLFGKISKILTEYPITYIKWDHNRNLPFPIAAQTEGFYALLKLLGQAHPDVEIESCSSGGGRIDYGVLKYCQRVWLSDSNDAIERWKMQNNASIWLPADVVGSHVGPRECHTSGRILPMAFRAWVAASRHMGFEMDPRELTSDEADILKEITAWYCDNRNWMHQGHIERLESDDPSVISEIVLSKDRAQFVVFSGQITPPDPIFTRPLRLTGLDANAHYEIALRNPQDAARISKEKAALSGQSLTLSGQSLMCKGIKFPVAFPATMWVLEGQKVT